MRFAGLLVLGLAVYAALPPCEWSALALAGVCALLLIAFHRERR
jgi:apolipoprotein N-acyltransferase